MPFDENYFNSKEFRELLNNYEASIKVGEYPFMDADDLVDIADYYNHLDRTEEANEVIDYALQLYPGSTLPNVFKARQALMNDNYEAAQHYSDCIESQDDPDYHYLQAEMLIAKHQIEEADRYLHDYEKRIDPDEYQDFIKDCANLFFDYGENEKAYEWLMYSRGDDSEDFKELMGNLLIRIEQYEEAETYFKELIDRNPYSFTYWKTLAGIQLIREDYPNAITSSEYAIAINPTDPDALLTKGNALLNMENYKEAEVFFRRYAKSRPDDEAGFFYIGVCLVNQGKYQEALEALLQAEELGGPDSPICMLIYRELAFCYSSLKQPQQALEQLNKIGKQSDDPNMLSVIKGHILLENGQTEEAEKVWQEAMINSNCSAEIMLRIVVSLYDNRYVEACYEILKRVCEYYKDDEATIGHAYSYMALCTHDLGLREEFLHYLKLTVEKYPKEAKSVLGFLFPAGEEVSDYYNFMNNKIKK